MWDIGEILPNEDQNPSAINLTSHISYPTSRQPSCSSWTNATTIELLANRR